MNKELQGLLLRIERDYYDEKLRWLVVSEPYAGIHDEMYGEIMRLRITPDLNHWLVTHKDEIESGDINPLLEYRRLLKLKTDLR
jgi:hypothetical protein